MLYLEVKKLDPRATLPSRANPNDAGLDLYCIEDVIINPGESGLVKTGISIALPPGTEGQIRPRSGLALKHQVTVLNTPGTIDEGYRGEVGVILINHGQASVMLEAGSRIAQLVVKPVLMVEPLEVAELSATERGEGGFGSSGV